MFLYIAQESSLKINKRLPIHHEQIGEVLWAYRLRRDTRACHAIFFGLFVEKCSPWNVKFLHKEYIQELLIQEEITRLHIAELVVLNEKSLY